jgi:hypothetical protein
MAASRRSQGDLRRLGIWCSSRCIKCSCAVLWSLDTYSSRTGLKAGEHTYFCCTLWPVAIILSSQERVERRGSVVAPPVKTSFLSHVFVERGPAEWLPEGARFFDHGGRAATWTATGELTLLQPAMMCTRTNNAGCPDTAEPVRTMHAAVRIGEHKSRSILTLGLSFLSCDLWVWWNMDHCSSYQPAEHHCGHQMDELTLVLTNHADRTCSELLVKLSGQRTKEPKRRCSGTLPAYSPEPGQFGRTIATGCLPGCTPGICSTCTLFHSNGAVGAFVLGSGAVASGKAGARQ